MTRGWQAMIDHSMDASQSDNLSTAPTRHETALYCLANLALRGASAVALVEQAALFLAQSLGTTAGIIVQERRGCDWAVVPVGALFRDNRVAGLATGAAGGVGAAPEREPVVWADLFVGDRIWGRLGLAPGRPGDPLAEAETFLKAMATMLSACLERANGHRNDPFQHLGSWPTEQASLFDLTNEAVLVHDLATGVIRFWNRGAERLYGWPRDEAIGRSAHQLLETAWSRPLLDGGPAQPLAAILAALVRTGRWEGELIHHTRQGGLVVVNSRWRVVSEAGGGSLVVLETNTDITAHHQMAEARARLAAIVESSDDAIYLRQLDGTITSWNPGAERLYGYSAEEAIGQSAARLIPPDRLDELPAAFARLMRDERIEPYETVRVHKSGRRLEVSLSISPVRDSDGHVTGAAIIARDITERQRARSAQAVLVRASAILATSLDDELTLHSVAHLVVPTLADACLIDLITETQGVRRLAVAVTSLDQPEPAGTLASTTSLEPAAASPDLIGLQADQSPLVTEATDPRLASLRQVIASLTAGWTRLASGAMIVPLVARGRTLGALTLITTQHDRRYDLPDLGLVEELAGRAALAVDNAHLYREAQRALARERSARSRAEVLAAERVAVLRQIADGVLIVDPSGHVTFANESAQQLFGGVTLGMAASHATAAQVLTPGGQPWPPADLPTARAAWQGETVVNAVLRLRRPDGTEAIVECYATPVIAEAGRRLGAVTTLRDVTARFQFERQKDEFFANIAHDLRTPLAGIKASIGVVLAYPATELPAPLRRLFSNINQTVDQTTTLVNDLLELARLQTGQAELQREPGDLREIIRRAVRTITPLARTREQHMRLSLPHRPVIMEVDAARLERAVLNLLSNAHAHGRAGGRIEVRLTRQPAAAVIEVIDDGPGIPLADQPHIFERFYRGGTTRVRRRPGSGLGLAITKALVELHGGRITVTSTPGAGAVFTIVVPFMTAPEIIKDETS